MRKAGYVNVLTETAETAEADVTVQFVSPSLSLLGSGTCLRLDGQDVSTFARSLELKAHVGSITTVTIEILPRKGFDLTVAARLQIVAGTGFELFQEPQENGTTRWFTKPVDRKVPA